MENSPGRLVSAKLMFQYKHSQSRAPKAGLEGPLVTGLEKLIDARLLLSKENKWGRARERGEGTVKRKNFHTPPPVSPGPVWHGVFLQFTRRVFTVELRSGMMTERIAEESFKLGLTLPRGCVFDRLDIWLVNPACRVSWETMSLLCLLSLSLFLSTYVILRGFPLFIHPHLDPRCFFSFRTRIPCNLTFNCDRDAVLNEFNANDNIKLINWSMKRMNELWKITLFYWRIIT